MPRQVPHDREIVNAVKDVAGLLLQATDWRECIDRVVACLGRGTDVSRVYIFENHPDPNGEPVAGQRFEWSAPGATVQLANPAHQNQTYAAMGMERWLGRIYQGTGLGLPVTKAFAELHGGTFEIESRPGEGTTARVRIPPERYIMPKRPLPGTAQS